MICPLEELVNSADFESAAKASTFESLGGSFWVDRIVAIAGDCKFPLF